mmetsp:Transcript_31462/g.56437  ORF Transcript_31462/g.56437 Transcript_31462/m.56437 type:complete len:238 (+) Transcript_31462:545-1258(+)
MDGLTLGVALDASRKLIAHALGGSEDDDLASRIPDQSLQMVLLLIRALAYDNLLLDVCVGLQGIRISDSNLNRVMEELRGQSTNLLWPRRCEHHRLTPCRHASNDLPDLRLESHVKHAVGLVHAKESNIAEVNHPSLQEVVQAAWGAREQMRPSPEICQLRALGSSSVGQCRGDASWCRILLAVGVDLHGQFSSRGHDKHKGPSRHSLRLHPPEARQQETERLPGASLRYGDEVAAP